MKNDYNDSQLIETQKQANVLYQGKILTLRVDDALLPNGDVCKREYVHHRGGAATLAIDKQGYAYLVKQFRYPYREVLLEIPAGKLEEGECPKSAAKRELFEETGLVADDLTDFGEVYPSPGYTDEHLYIYYADKFEKSTPKPDVDEFLNVVKLPFDTVYDMVLSGEIKDAKTCYAVLKAKAFKSTHQA